MYLDEAFDAEGSVVATNAQVTGSIMLSGATIGCPDGVALGLQGASVRGRLYLGPEFGATGTVVLNHCTVGGLYDEKASWPERMEIDGFEYSRLYGKNRGWKSRSEWLRRQVHPSPQGYIELAKVYRATGHERDARKILIERHNTLLNPPEHWKTELPTGVKGTLFRMWRYFLRYTIGHGYEPWRIVGFALPLVVGMSLAYTWARHDNVMRPTGDTPAQASRCTSDYPCLQPVVYALDTLLPIIDFNQADKWTPDQSRKPGKTLAVWTWFTIGAGWVFATLVAASFTQAVRRE